MSAPSNATFVSIAGRAEIGLAAGLRLDPIVHWSARRIVAYQLVLPAADERNGEPTAAGATLPLLADGLVALVRGLPEDSTIFVRVGAQALAAMASSAGRDELAAVADRIVLELSRVPGGIGGRDLSRLRRAGYALALEDLGRDGALSDLLLVEPDYVKVGPGLAGGIARSPRRRSLVRALRRVCERELGIRMVCDGMADPLDLQTLAEEGCDLFRLPGIVARPPARRPRRRTGPLTVTS